MANTVTVPGGSSSVLVPPSSSGGTPASGSSWTTRYEVDFTAQGTWDAQAAGDTATFDMEGVRWEARGTANATSMGVNSSGMHFTCNTNSSDWWSALTAPRIFCKLTMGTNPIYANAGPGQAFAFQWIVEQSGEPDHNWNGQAGSVFDVDGHSVSSLGRIHVDSAKNKFGYYQGGGYEELKTGSFYSFNEMVFMKGSYLVTMSSATSLVDPLTETGFRSYGGIWTGKAIENDVSEVNYANLFFCFLSFRNGGSGTAQTATFKKFRVLTLGEEGSL